MLILLFSNREMPCKIVDIDLVDENIPVLLTSDGALRVYDKSLSQQVSPVSHDTLQGIFCPTLLPPTVAESLKILLTDSLIRESAGGKFSLSHLDAVLSKSNLTAIEKALIMAQLNSLEEDHLSILCSHDLNDPLNRGVFISRLLGNELEYQLWLVLKSISSPKEALPPSFDILCDATTFQRKELLKSAVFDAKRASYEQISSHIEKLILLRRTDQAVQLLLDTDSSHPQYLADNFKACLISAVSNSTQCQSTIKLVATNMIASGKLSEGTQLLSLIDLNADACRYLQSYNKWSKAAWLAKITLKDNDMKEAYRKWLDYLSSSPSGQKGFALLLAVSIQHYERALELLIALRQFRLAVCILQALTNNVSLGSSNVSQPVAECVYAEYAKELHYLGFIQLSSDYCKLAGERGRQLEEEFTILQMDKTQTIEEQ